MSTVSSIDFLTGWEIVLYFAVLITQLLSLYRNAKKGKYKFAIGSITFILIFSYLYLSKYYTLK